MLVFQGVNPKKSLLIVLLIGFISLDAFSQNLVKIDSLVENEKPISLDQLKMLSKNNGVIFFCSKDYEIEQYKAQASLFDFSKLDSNKTTSVNFILFREYDNISKNPFITNSGFKDSLISQIECYLVSQDSSNINRALEIFGKNFYILNNNKEKGFYQLSFKGICPKDLPSSISLFYDLIYEIFNPNYTTEERLSRLENENRQLRVELIKINEEIKNLKKQNSQPSENIILEVEDKKSKRKQ